MLYYTCSNYCDFNIHTDDPSTIWPPISKTSSLPMMISYHSHLQSYTRAYRYQIPYPSIFSISCLTLQPHLSFQLTPSSVPNPIILRCHLDGIAVSFFLSLPGHQPFSTPYSPSCGPLCIIRIFPCISPQLSSHLQLILFPNQTCISNSPLDWNFKSS